MARPSVVCALVALLSTPALAGQKQPAETVVRLTVAPAAAPKPALKYRLLPEPTRIRPGNPVQGFLECFMGQSNFFYGKEAVAEREKWQIAPLASLPVSKLRDQGGLALRRADRAARLDTPDWQALPKLQRDGALVILPELHPMRVLAAALKVRFRAEVAEKRFDEAIQTAQTMFALARCLGRHPTLVGNLIGFAVGALALGPLEEMVQQPGCPNLYWALTELPSPLVDLREGLQGECVLGAREMALLDDRTAMSATDLEKVAARVVAVYKGMNLKYVDQDDGGKQPPGEWLRAKAKDQGHVEKARARLVSRGLPEKAVARFPALQVVLLDEKREYEERRDEAMKGMLLPYWQSEPPLGPSRVKHKGGALFRPIVPSSRTTRNAQVRLEQRLALLRTVEALRLHAATHRGKLPDKLTDLAVPLPIDPVTGKPFSYSKEGGRAVLKGTPARGRESSAAFNLRFEVTLKP
jgi:hypothetical protein